ncbi:hypothetical protein [Bradyrhizobium jicamae]|uniref:hypothetical protein n=1 Tax=Bradyrhizobium jicamae TaxID=280332 RepID=UPI001BAC41F5|nr:hypothetical protein [Bradyrhizobium jicamae]MBR0931975.1 hypothetical protein [Bradyrhizobium jicamae]
MFVQDLRQRVIGAAQLLAMRYQGAVRSGKVVRNRSVGKEISAPSHGAIWIGSSPRRRASRRPTARALVRDPPGADLVELV